MLVFIPKFLLQNNDIIKKKGSHFQSTMPFNKAEYHNRFTKKFIQYSVLAGKLGSVDDFIKLTSEKEAFQIR